MECMSANRQPGFDAVVVPCLEFIISLRNLFKANGFQLSARFIKLITHKREPDLGQVHPNLMITARQRPALHQRVMWKPFEHSIMSLSRFRIDGVSAGRHQDAPPHIRSADRQLDRISIARHNALDQSMIRLADTAHLE